MKIDLLDVEEVSKTLYIRALKVLPPDIKRGFDELVRSETNPTGQAVLQTMIKNITVAEDTDNLLCQDTGIPIYNVTIGREIEYDGYGLKQAIRAGCARATREYPLQLVGGAYIDPRQRAYLVRARHSGDPYRFFR